VYTAYKGAGGVRSIADLKPGVLGLDATMCATASKRSFLLPTVYSATARPPAIGRIMYSDGANSADAVALGHKSPSARFGAVSESMRRLPLERAVCHQASTRLMSVDTLNL
jgi:hypothetical protein